MATESEQELLEEIARLRQENELLRQKVDLLVKRIFGASSEKLDARQLAGKTMRARIGSGGHSALEGRIDSV